MRLNSKKSKWVKTRKCKGSINHVFFPWNSTWKRQQRFLLWGATCPFPWNCCSDSHHEQHEGESSSKQAWRPAEHPLSGYLKVSCYAKWQSVGLVTGYHLWILRPVLYSCRGMEPFLRIWVYLGIPRSSSSGADDIHSAADQSVSKCCIKQIGVIRSICFSCYMRRLLSMKNNTGKCPFVFIKQSNKKWLKMRVLCKWQGRREQLNCSVRKSKYLVRYVVPSVLEGQFLINLKS